MGREVFESRGLGGREALMEDIKTKAGELDELLRQVAADITTGTSASTEYAVRPRECQRLTALARTSLEQSVMWAVKAISRGQ
jgi:hypothetical protein